jgi:hypothetical protein
VANCDFRSEKIQHFFKTSRETFVVSLVNGQAMILKIGFLLAKLFSTSFKLCTVLEVIFANFRQGLVTSHAVVL